MLMANFLLHTMGVPAPKYGMLYGTILNPQADIVPYSGIWWLGLMSHFVLGTVVFSFIFDYVSELILLTESPWVKGLVYGVVAAVLFCLVIAPIAGEKAFFTGTAHAAWMTVSTIVAMLVYGTTLEELSDTHQETRDTQLIAHPWQKRAA
jgi:uncharacterized membrane protein YagU involved in acid resistance